MVVAIENLSGKVDEMSLKMEKLFAQLGDKMELNIAKQNAFASVETMLYGVQKFQDMQNDCVSTKNMDDSTSFPFSINRARCELSQEIFVNLLVQINFDYHYNEVLKVYAGDTNIMGIDFFSKITEVVKFDKEKVLMYYKYFQDLIKSSTLTLFVYKSL